MSQFKSTNADGSPKTCKFCHEPVWWDVLNCRWYNPGGEVLHVTTCERSAKFHHDKGMDSAESRRKKS